MMISRHDAPSGATLDVKFMIVSPDDPGVNSYWFKEFCQAHATSPGDWRPFERRRLFETILGSLGLIYINDRLYGYFAVIDRGCRDAELHGGLCEGSREWLRALVPYHGRVHLAVHTRILEYIYCRLQKDQVVIPGDTQNPGLKGFIRIWAFKPLADKPGWLGLVRVAFERRRKQLKI